MSQGQPNPVTSASRHPTYSRDEEEDMWVEEEDEEAEFIVNRIHGEMTDAVTWEEVELSISQDCTLQAVMEDIKKGTLRKYKECFTELSSASEVVIRGEKLVLPKALVPVL